jgi:hypothetical protein
MSPEFTKEEISHAVNIGGPLKPIHVPVERAGGHPLLRHAVIEDGPYGHRYVTWPGFTERQAQEARDTVKLHLHTGSLYFSMPPRINADWWLPPNPTQDDLRWFYGSVADLQRWYLVIEPIVHPARVTLVTAFNTDDGRTFMQRAHRAGWMPLPAAAFVDMLDNPELVVTPTDQITADTWEQIWAGR